ncbi:MAG: nuclear transport factor 2 family protein [Ilumatobacter sp.]|nr:nuclear transport factor 2 family protein [Ilumatobacter sp.]
MSPVEVVEQWQARAWGECDLTAVDELAGDPLLRHGPSGTQSRSHAELKHDLRQYQRALGQPQITVHDRVLDGDKVWSRVTMKGVSADSGEQRTVQWLQIHRVVDGRIVELWALYATDVGW